MATIRKRNLEQIKSYLQILDVKCEVIFNIDKYIVKVKKDYIENAYKKFGGNLSYFDYALQLEKNLHQKVYQNTKIRDEDLRIHALGKLASNVIVYGHESYKSKNNIE